MTAPNQPRQLLKDLCGGAVPRLWCPPITHYTRDGQLDQNRMAAHWEFMSQSVNSFLVPGSTGDAWEMSDAEQMEVLDLALDFASKRKSLLLLGTLRTEIAAARQAISSMLTKLKSRAKTDDPIQAMKANRVCGFVVCAPRGSELSQDQIRTALQSVLDLGLPTALYQLPQITQNEIFPELASELAAAYPNLLLLKDSGGKDQVALADRGRSGLFLVRGAEGNYAKWLRESGGPYDGLLLSTANSFPAQLKSIVEHLEAGRCDEAVKISDQLTRVIQKVFEIVGPMKDGNAFANANKAMDSFMAFGAAARSAPPPRLHAGSGMPKEVILRVGEVLEAERLIPDHGYVVV